MAGMSSSHPSPAIGARSEVATYMYAPPAAEPRQKTGFGAFLALYLMMPIHVDFNFDFLSISETAGGSLDVQY